MKLQSNVFNLGFFSNSGVLKLRLNWKGGTLIYIPPALRVRVDSHSLCIESFLSMQLDPVGLLSGFYVRNLDSSSIWIWTWNMLTLATPSWQSYCSSHVDSTISLCRLTKVSLTIHSPIFRTFANFNHLYDQSYSSTVMISSNRIINSNELMPEEGGKRQIESGQSKVCVFPALRNYDSPINEKPRSYAQTASV